MEGGTDRRYPGSQAQSVSGGVRVHRQILARYALARRGPDPEGTGSLILHFEAGAEGGGVEAGGGLDEKNFSTSGRGASGNSSTGVFATGGLDPMRIELFPNAAAAIE